MEHVGSRFGLLLALGSPRPVGAAFHLHPARGGAAVDPSGQHGRSGNGFGLAVLLRPVRGEVKLDIAVTPGAGDGQG